MTQSLKVKIGVFLVILSMIIPLFSFLIPLLGMSSATSALVISFLVIGAPELCLILAAIIAGKEILQQITGKIKAFFRISLSPKPVSRSRYRLGIVLLLVGIVVPWVGVYLPYLPFICLRHIHSLFINLIGDAFFISSFFVLGKPFWEKLHKLFVWEPN